MEFDAIEHVEINRISGGENETLIDSVINEVPVALIYNGEPHVVIMCSPIDLLDFVYGFSLTEGIIQQKTAITSIKQTNKENGIELHIEIDALNMQKMQSRKRQMSARTGCGICGLDSLANVVRPMEVLTHKKTFTLEAINQALKQAKKHQKLGEKTGASHAAFLCNELGEIVIAREDVGRHVALDKLIGASGNEAFLNHFCLITSRASFEMVQKAIVANCSLLVALSAPTAMAIALAKKHRLTLMGFASPSRINVYSDFPQSEK